MQFQCSDLFVQFVVIWNIVSASTKMSFVNLYDVDELGNFVLIGCVNVKGAWSRFWSNFIFLFLLFTMLYECISNDHMNFESKS